MCEQDEVTRVKLCRYRRGWFALIDRCIAPIVQALNDAGIATIASCCGHGKIEGSIILADGREMLIRKDPHTPVAKE